LVRKDGSSDTFPTDHEHVAGKVAQVQKNRRNTNENTEWVALNERAEGKEGAYQ
jgi:hypothetical protein